MTHIKNGLYSSLMMVFFVSMLIFMILFTAAFISVPFVLLSLSIGEVETVYMFTRYLLIFAEISLVSGLLIKATAFHGVESFEKLISKHEGSKT